MLDLCTNSKFLQQSLTLWACLCKHKLRKASLHSSDFCGLCSSPFGIWGAQLLLQVLSCLQVPVYTTTLPSCPGAAAVWCNRLAAGHSHFLTAPSKGRRISTAENTTVHAAHRLTGLISAKVLPFHLFSTETFSKTESFKKTPANSPNTHENFKTHYLLHSKHKWNSRII